MKELRGTASAAVAASPDECLALLEAVDRYPDWYPEVVRAVEVLQRDPAGVPSRVRTQLHVAQGPLSKDFDLLMAVAVQRPSTVKLSRVADGHSDQEVFEVAWFVEAGTGTRIRVELHANLSVPRFFPVGGIGDSIAGGFVAAAIKALTSHT